MSRKILGLDIRHDSISGVLVDSGLKTSRIEAHAFIPLEGRDDLEAALIQSLSELTGELNPSGVSVIASFPAESVSFRNIHVPFREPKKITKVLPFELESTLPYPIEEVIIDFQALKTDGIQKSVENLDVHPMGTSGSTKSKEDQTYLITAAVEKSRLRSYLAILSSFHIDPEVVAVGGYSTAKTLAGVSSLPENWLLLDADHCKTTLFAVVSRQLFLVRSFSECLTVPSKAQITPEERTPNIETLCNAIKRTLLASFDIIPLDFKPECLFVTGGAAIGISFETDMSLLLGIPVKPLDLARIKEFEVPDIERWEPLRMDNAFALAVANAEGLGGINFRKDEFATKKQWLEHKASFIKTGIIAAVALVLALSNVVFESYSLKKQVNEIDQRINGLFQTTFPDVKKIVDPLQQMKAKIEEAKKASLGDTGVNIRVIDILHDIASLIEKEIDVKLSRLVVGPDGIVISGDTDTNSSVDSIKSRLEKSSILKKITITSTKKGTEDRISFKINVDL